MSEETDQNDRLYHLLAAVALQDRKAFRALYDATSAKLFGVALRVLRKDELAEDAVQDAFVAIWHAASGYQPHLAAPLTWMVTIVRNKALDILRRARTGGADVQVELDDADVRADTAAGPYELAQASRDARALADCMDTLAGRQRQAIGMAYLHDLSHSEVAGRLDLPIGTVKTWIRRGLERLRECLAKREAA
ncbi:sigma-70 family RNA polymerase sigma factor [Massilia luteola]|uniref:sigma-70 family RNA polymerase sigma factor n=1 Tax=Massilia luteola TaxID=3081751 RepID=UPI002ACC073D|nr:sigma-70 family RNA polymerase sigma factor [Massilia sp. Gc5]